MNLRSPWLTLAIAISAWSLSPLLIVSADDLAEPYVVALYAVVIGATVTVLVASGTNLNARVAYRICQHTGVLWRAVAVGTGGFFVYPLLYFSAIQTGPPIAANLVNYLWPIVGLLIVAYFRQERRSIELFLAGGFGFSGAVLAVTAGGRSVRDLPPSVLPYVLAAFGAFVYGGVSAATNIWSERLAGVRLPFVFVALMTGGILSAIALTVIGLTTNISVVPNVNSDSGRVIALLCYSVLLPCAHLSWLTAVQHQQIPGFTAAFLVPVLATALLAVVTTGYAGAQLLAAFTMVLCGVAFSSAHTDRIPGSFAVWLCALGSVLVSQTLPEQVTSSIKPVLTVFNEPLVSLVSIFGGFVLTNAIVRYGKLQDACVELYSRASSLLSGERAKLQIELDRVDEMVLNSTRREDVTPIAKPVPVEQELCQEWARLDVLLVNRVSRYEWLVLALGSVGIIIALHVSATLTGSIVALILRSLSTAVVVGIPFAVRDYDLNRPDRVIDFLCSLRERYRTKRERFAFGSRNCYSLSEANSSSLVGNDVYLNNVRSSIHHR
jgi:drug/metabolite transporter (DMT)-like permease